MKHARGNSPCNLLAGLISATVAVAAFGALSGCSASHIAVVSTSSTSTPITSSGTTTTSTGGGVTSILINVPPPANTIYAFQSPSTGDASILQFAASSSGSVAPAATLVLPTPQILSWNGITTDFNGNIYAWGNQIANQPSEILVYSTNAGPSPSVLETIVGGPNTFPYANDVAVDAMGEIYVETGNATAGNPAILVFPQDVSPTAVPVRTIKGSLTGLDGSGYMAFDGSDYLYVSNDTNTPGEIRVFSPDATGNTPPVRVIGGTNTLLTTWVLGIDVDSSGNIYAVVWLPATNSTEIVEFAAGASGNVAPTAIIDGTIAGEQAVNVRVDADGNLYVLCESQALPPATDSPLIALFSKPVASGATPASQFTSAAWTAPTGNFALH